ncbi:hypothetical protein ACFY94_03035 [Streptomyces griseorubiginosus]|uniref:hypothetical protein n=1 Tax=Streptomyces griseorubiginosus TaxID=67304 RepID=UPI0036F180A5
MAQALPGEVDVVAGFLSVGDEDLGHQQFGEARVRGGVLDGHAMVGQVETVGDQGPSPQPATDLGHELVPEDRQRGAQVTTDVDELVGGGADEGLDADVPLDEDVRRTAEDEVGRRQIAEHDQRRAAVLQVEDVAVDMEVAVDDVSGDRAVDPLVLGPAARLDPGVLVPVVVIVQPEGAGQRRGPRMSAQ